MRVWVLSKHYDCPEHEHPWPVVTAYGVDHHCPGRPALDNGVYALMSIETDPEHINAMREDPRIIYCGRSFSTPPQILLELYRHKLDPNTTYLFMGQVIEQLAQSEPAFYHKD